MYDQSTQLEPTAEATIQHFWIHGLIQIRKFAPNLLCDSYQDSTKIPEIPRQQNEWKYMNAVKHWVTPQFPGSASVYQTQDNDLI